MLECQHFVLRNCDCQLNCGFLGVLWCIPWGKVNFIASLQVEIVLAIIFVWVKSYGFAIIVDLD